jgi:hypothetical protein
MTFGQLELRVDLEVVCVQKSGVSGDRFHGVRLVALVRQGLLLR